MPILLTFISAKKLGELVQEVWKIVSREAKDLLARCLDINASNRVSAEEALQHPWFGNAVITVSRRKKYLSLYSVDDNRHGYNYTR